MTSRTQITLDSQEMRDSLASMEAFAMTLIEKLAAFRAMLDDEQRTVLASELARRGRRSGPWRGWHRCPRLRHRNRVA